MHHIFYVENGLALALVTQYIKELKIDAEKTIVLLGRQQKANLPYTTKDVSDWEFRTSINFFKGWKKTSKIEQEVNEFLQLHQVDQFNLYTASISKLSCYFLINHNKRNKLAIVEDGRAAYYSESEFKQYIKELHFSGLSYPFYMFKCWLNYRFKHYPNPNKTIETIKEINNSIVSSTDSFPYSGNKHVVTNLFFSNEVNYTHVECLMCLSYPVEDGLILLNDYANVLNATFSHLTSKGIKKVHYKFHPQQMSNPDNLAQYKSIMNSFRSDLEFVELPKETIMEEVMANSNAILLSDYSSIMIYTKNFGNEIVSNYNLIQKYRSKGSKMPLLPAVLTQIINKTGIPLHQ